MGCAAGVDLGGSRGSEKMASGRRNEQNRQEQTGFVESRNL
jgi:hypothetical protein